MYVLISGAYRRLVTYGQSRNSENYHLGKTLKSSTNSCSPELAIESICSHITKTFTNSTHNVNQNKYKIHGGENVI